MRGSSRNKHRLNLRSCSRFGLDTRFGALCGGDALIRAEAPERAGSYDESLSAREDPELCLKIKRLGYKIVRLDRTYSRPRLSYSRLWQYWRRSAWTGYAYAEVSERSRYADHLL